MVDIWMPYLGLERHRRRRHRIIIGEFKANHKETAFVKRGGWTTNLRVDHIEIVALFLPNLSGKNTENKRQSAWKGSVSGKRVHKTHHHRATTQRSHTSYVGRFGSGGSRSRWRSVMIRFFRLIFIELFIKTRCSLAAQLNTFST